MDLTKLIEKLDNSHIHPPLETEDFYGASFAVSVQNDFREKYLQEYVEDLVKAVKKYVLHSNATMFLKEENLFILTNKVKVEFEILLYTQAPTAPMVREILLWMIEK